MNTWTHLLVGGVLNRPIKKHQSANPDPKLPKMRTGWFLFGSILPDLMLILITAGVIIYDLGVGNMTLSAMTAGGGAPGEPPPGLFNSNVENLFSDWFFNDPWVIAGHHIFGSPLMLFVYLGLGYWLWRKNGSKWGAIIFWIAVGGLIHNVGDIPLHVNDGPLIFWPLNWSYRFESPISYWDPEHHGAAWSVFEMGLNLAMIAFLLGGWMWRRLKKS